MLLGEEAEEASLNKTDFKGVKHLQTVQALELWSVWLGLGAELKMVAVVS